MWCVDSMEKNKETRFVERILRFLLLEGGGLLHCFWRQFGGSQRQHNNIVWRSLCVMDLLVGFLRINIIV